MILAEMWKQKGLADLFETTRDPRALNSMGAMRAYQKRDEDAVAYYKHAIAMDPTNYVYLANLADSERRLGSLRDANAAYRKAMDIALLELEQDPRRDTTEGSLPTSPPAWETGSARKVKSHRPCRCPRARPR